MLLQSDGVTYGLIDTLRNELRLAATASNSGNGKLDPKQMVFYPLGKRLNLYGEIYVVAW